MKTINRALEQAVIIAGGKGTRLAPFTDNNPKPMYPVNGKPFIDRLVEQIHGFGINDIVIMLGYLPDKIKDHLGDGSRCGVNITYDITPEEYETADRFVHARRLLADEFLFMYCDNFCPIDYGRLCNDYFNNRALIQISAYANKDGYTRNNLLIGDKGQVICYDKARKREDTQGVDIGYAIVNKSVLDNITSEGLNFEAAVYPQLIEEGKLFATVTEHRYYSVGSWERMKLTEEFFSDRKTIFLDRDGTLNVRPPKACYIERPEDFVWLSGSMEALRILKEYGYRIVLITNQPGIARGNLTVEMLNKIHEKMQFDLERSGIKGGIDDIIYCPHNWDEGCDCRKPKPGMLYQAQKKYSLNLTKCIMIGDDDRDIEAGKTAGCTCIQVTDDYCLLDAVKDIINGKEVSG